MHAPAVIAHYAEQRRALIESAEPGIASARRLAALTDATLREHAERAAADALPENTRWALVALGGYGAGALLPKSDLDLLVLCDASSSGVKRFVEAVLYPLWDAGLDVGHQVRSPREQLRAVRADTATLTSALTARPIAGDAAYAEEAIARCAADAAKRRTDILRALGDRDRPGSPYLLEPDLKDGAGGRRDYDELVWTAAVVTGARQDKPDALVAVGLLDDEELQLVRDAAVTIAAARWSLQVAGFGNRMAEEALEEPDSLAIDAESVQRALADTYHVLERVRARRGAKRRGATSHARQPLSEPAEVLAALQSGATALPSLQEAAWAGDLDVFVPGMRSLMTLRRPGIAHELTVGAHSLAAATTAADIVAKRTGDAFSRSAAALVGDVRPLLVAALVHDVGKREAGPDHAERGVEPARIAATKFGIPQYAETIATLVRHHLLLAQAAGSRDLDDEDSVLHVAGMLGDPDLLAPLFVLTAADSIATGPAAWTDWHAALIGKLAARIEAALSPDVDGAGLADEAESVRASALSLLGEDHPLRDVVSGLPARYLAGRSPEDVARHSALIASVSERGTPAAFAIDVAVGPIEGTYRITFVTRDRHGLFAVFAGVLALAGLDILAADGNGTPGGIALDSFTVRSATLAPVDHAVWSRVERLLDLALKGRLAIKVRLAERARQYRHEPPGKLAFEIDLNDPYAAVLSVRAPDRVGLLHDIALAIAESGLEIVSATALTRDDTAEDTFRLLDASGDIPREAGLLGQLGMRLRRLG